MRRRGKSFTKQSKVVELIWEGNFNRFGREKLRGEEDEERDGEDEGERVDIRRSEHGQTEKEYQTKETKIGIDLKNQKEDGYMRELKA